MSNENKTTASQMTFGMCTHCGKAPATRMPLKHCIACAEELFKLPPGMSPERIAWFKNGKSN